MNELGRRLMAQLKIPVDSGIDFETWAEVKYDGQNIGNVYITKTPGNVIIDTSPGSVTNLRWDYIYTQNSGAINALIAEHLATPAEDLQVTLGLFRTLYVRNADGSGTKNILCTYEDGRWYVHDSN